MRAALSAQRGQSADLSSLVEVTTAKIDASSVTREHLRVARLEDMQVRAEINTVVDQLPAPLPAGGSGGAASQQQVPADSDSFVVALCKELLSVIKVDFVNS